MIDLELNPWICPICKNKLTFSNNALSCINKHSFDISKNGYVNLLMSSSRKNHGDDKIMVKSRTCFLSKGYYNNLADSIIDSILSIQDGKELILDAGCGEGYYTELISNSVKPVVSAIDVSKEAVNSAAKRRIDAYIAVASSSCIPLADCSTDIIINIFSPIFIDEFYRILKPGGIIIRALPGINHLLELKKVIYDYPYLNPEPECDLEGFEIVSDNHLEYILNINDNTTIKELFMMTPYYYKTSLADQQKLDNLSYLETKADFHIIINKVNK